MPLCFSERCPPIPPIDMITRVVTHVDVGDIEGARQAFDLDARTHLRTLERGLAVTGRDFGDFRRLLDFGCGPGRFIRHLGPLSETVEVHGVDIDAEMIAWLRENIDFGTFTLGPHEPPLPFDDGFFDLVINHSVFTHIDERMQDLWLAELQRITCQGAILLLTVQSLDTWNKTLELIENGRENLERFRNGLESRGILFIAEDHFVGSTHPDFYHSTFHAPWYLFEHWTKYFDIYAYIPNGSLGQDLLVLRRRQDEAAQPTPIGHLGDSFKAEPPSSETVPLGSDPAQSEPEVVRKNRRTFFELARVAFRKIGAVKRLPARLRSLEADVASFDAKTVSFDAEIVSFDARMTDLQRDDEARNRELAMLRAGLYEQGNRISLIAHELREEIAAQNNGSDNPDG